MCPSDAAVKMEMYVMERYLLSGNDKGKKNKTMEPKTYIYTSCLFPSAETKDAIQLKPPCHLLARKSLGNFFPPALFSITTPTADMFDSHTVAAVVIFRL